MISIIAAVSQNNIIGKDGKLPWNIPNDLQWFKSHTSNKTIIMGRKTFESLPKILPNRKHVVFSRNVFYNPGGVEVVHTVEQALKQDENLFIIGGAEIYKMFLPYADRIYLTEIHCTVEGDTSFPEFDRSQWKEFFRESHPDYSFVILERGIT